MGLWNWLVNGPAPALELREISPDAAPTLEQQISAMWRGRYSDPWMMTTVRDALAIPAVFRSVNLIANVCGTFPIDTYHDGVLLDPLDAPSVIRRPDPFNTPRSFRRNTAWNLACYGEAIWWIAARGEGGIPSTLLNLHPPEVTVTWDKTGLRPVFEWRDKDITADVQHLTVNRLGDSPRGAGPLQLCMAVLSAAYEATEWAARFMAGGGIPSMILKHPSELTAKEADDLKTQWMSTPPGMPKVTSGGLEAEAFQVNPRDAQLLEVRDQSAAEVARMFGLNPHVLLVNNSGSSLTYQNLGELGTELLRLTLIPNYLEPIQQAFSDLLPRTYVCRFNTDEFQRADPLTRYQTYQAGITAGVLTVEEARDLEFAGKAGAQLPNRAPAEAMPTVPRAW